jgi:hypothetical protein
VLPDGTTGECILPRVAAQVVGAKRLGAKDRTWSVEAAVPPILWRAIERVENPTYDVPSQGRVYINHACDVALNTNRKDYAHVENLQCYIDRLNFLAHHCPNTHHPTYENLNVELVKAKAAAPANLPPCPTPHVDVLTPP